MIKSQVFSPTGILSQLRGREFDPAYVSELGYDDPEFTQKMYAEHKVVCASIFVPDPKIDMIFCHGNAQNMAHTLSGSKHIVDDELTGHAREAALERQMRQRQPANTLWDQSTREVVLKVGHNLWAQSTREVMFRVAESMSANITLVEYPGYDSDRTSATEEGCCEAAWKVLCVKISAMRTDASHTRPLVMCGYSLGCSIAVRCMARMSMTRTMDAYAARVRLLLLAPFESAICSVVPRWIANTVLWPMDMFRTDDAHNITVPVYIIHGEDDMVVPPSGAVALIEKMTGTDAKDLRMLPNMNHELFSDTNICRVLEELKMYTDHL